MDYAAYRNNVGWVETGEFFWYVGTHTTRLKHS
jgi:hypothetical protein